MQATPTQLARRTERAANQVPLPSAWRIGLGSFVRALVRQIEKDRLPVYAGNLAFRWLLGLFPALIAVLWLLQTLEGDGLINALFGVINVTLPEQSAESLRTHLETQRAAGSDASLSFSAVLAVCTAAWLITSAFRGVMDALNAMYAVEDHRPLWKRYLLAVGLAAGVLTLLVGAMLLIVSGDALAERAAEATGWGTAARWAWSLVTWPAVAVAAMAAFGMVYYFGPDCEQRVRWISPGAIIAVVLWLLFTILFSIYMNHGATYARLFGALSGIAVFIVYLFASAFILLLGAEMNQVIEMQHPDGKDEGDKAPTDGGTPDYADAAPSV